MAQNEPPLFPREPEQNSDLQDDLLQEVKQKLELEESSLGLELPNSRQKDSMPPLIIPAYGPPVFFSEESTSPPPPVPTQRKIIVFALGGLLFAVFLAIAVWWANKTPLSSPPTPRPESERKL
jgi:hypothetical protein